MIGSLLSRLLLLALGYAYPAFESYKAVERNKSDNGSLRFWCQYWIIVALLTVAELLADMLISRIPLYHEAKVSLLIYLWHPSTRGTRYVYKTILQPYIGSYEAGIDMTLTELRSRAVETLLVGWKVAAASCHSRVLQVAHCLAALSVYLRSSLRPVPRKTDQKFWREGERKKYMDEKGSNTERHSF